MLRPWDLQIKINFNCERPVYVQIADGIITAIKDGKLKSGHALPGSRQLAVRLGVNRNTLVDALALLLTEGWLVARPRKGTFVAETLPATRRRKLDVLAETTTIKTMTRPRMVFDDGWPDSRIAPINELARAYRQIFDRKARWQMMGYGHALGDPEFRNAIVHMLNFKRGMRVSADEICITRGSQMAMYLTAHSLLEKGDAVIVENPGYRPAWQALQNAGATLLPVRVDHEGLLTDEVKAYLRRNKKIKALYTTPHHQFPTTVTLSMARRQELIELSNQFGFTIIEDDYDNEFHFSETPVLPLSSSENLQQWIYIGSLSKIIAPALRIGYVISSKSFIDSTASLRKIVDVQGDNIMEQALLQLVNDGAIRRHLKKATEHYKIKRDIFENLIQNYAADKVTFQKPDGGLAFWLIPRDEKKGLELSKSLSMRGIEIISPQQFSFGEPVNGLRLGYASPTEKQLKEGIMAIAELL